MLKVFTATHQNKSLVYLEVIAAEIANITMDPFHKTVI